MAKWRVYGTVTVLAALYVEAETKEEALEIADDEWPGLTDYAGNGAVKGRLVGHTEPRAEIEASDNWPQWYGAEKAE